MKRVVVLGGSGFVGRALCRRLVARWPALCVVVPTRRAGHAQALRPLPTVLTPVADVHDAATLANLLTGADAVVNLVAILHGTAAAFERVHVELPRRLVAACRTAGVTRVLHVSALGVGPEAPSNYLRSKTQGEQVLQQAGLALTVLRPSVIFGAEDRFLNLFAKLQALAPVLPLGGSAARFQPVWVEDVAEALLRSLGRPLAGLPPVIECAGPQVFTLAELVQRAGRWSGHERLQIPLPAPLARLQAGLLEWMPGPTLMSRDNLDSMRVPNVASGALPGLDALGIAATAIEAVMPAVLAVRSGPSQLDRLRAGR
ncbi:MAG: complex I NDUFA9 subunit family protein [Rubrivivax sp.]|nr:complex I NDUFA9 subunit family protein [Rubrivivax sp.]